MKNKYSIAKEFRKLKFIKRPLNGFFLRAANFVLGCLFPKNMKSNKYVKIEKTKIKSFDGKSLKSYVVMPAACEKQKLPVLVYFHGGGFLFKGVFVHYRNIKTYAVQAGVKVVYVDYRLAYNNAYPTSLKDCFECYKWVIDNADNYGFDLNNIVVGGDSAGGCLAAGVTLLANDFNLTKPTGQLLIYPLGDKRMITDSMKEFKNVPLWNAKLNEKMWKIYLNKINDETYLKYASPFENKDFSVFPTTYIETAEIDCLHDEGVHFYENLKSVKCDVCLHETKGTVHGYDVVSKSDITKDSIQKRVEFLKLFTKAD